MPYRMDNSERVINPRFVDGEQKLGDLTTERVEAFRRLGPLHPDVGSWLLRRQGGGVGVCFACVN